MRNVIVTGATGFIGLWLVRILEERLGPGARVTGVGSRTVDLVDQSATFDWFKAHGGDVDHVFHLAALYKAGDWPVHHPATQFFANMSINVNVLEAWARFLPGARFTSVLSYCMYPSHPAPHPESELYGTEPEEYLFAYALTKKAMLVGQRAYRQEHGLDCTSVVLPTVFGPGDSFAENSHVVGALIGKFVRATLDGTDEIEVWGDGTQEREFLYVEDAVEGMLAAARDSKVDVLNLGTGTAYSIRQLVEFIREASGFEGRVRQNPQKFVGVSKRVLDVSRIRTELCWSAPTETREGIRRTVQWYRAQLTR